MAITPKLSRKQERFIAEYLVDLNATQAAIRAGYSPKTAHAIGGENLKKPAIAEAIQTAQSARLASVNITAQRVLSELARIGFSDVRKVFGPSGTLRDAEEWDDETGAAVSAVEVVETRPGEKDAESIYTKKIKLWDKNTALGNLAKHLGLLVDKVEHTASMDLVKALSRKAIDELHPGPGKTS